MVSRDEQFVQLPKPWHQVRAILWLSALCRCERALLLITSCPTFEGRRRFLIYFARRTGKRRHVRCDKFVLPGEWKRGVGEGVAGGRRILRVNGALGPRVAALYDGRPPRKGWVKGADGRAGTSGESYGRGVPARGNGESSPRWSTRSPLSGCRRCCAAGS